ncbi:MAG: coproporphyrinogen-III oxidase family protein, partial [Acidimicrobiales bacterium]
LLPATSVFFGGGTPSLLPADLLCSILDSIEVAPGAEVTVECNPENVTPALARSYARAGVNRVSIGVQSMAPRVLVGLGRQHDPACVPTALAMMADAGIVNLSVDLIYGGAGENDADWAQTLDTVLGFDPGPSHVSAYALTVEPGTPLALDLARHPDDDVQADRYAMADDRLAEAGFGWYEISNWAKPGRECRHNQLYWSQGNYLGVGAAAHSHWRGRRGWNMRTPERYMKAVAGAHDLEAGVEFLNETQRRMEGLQLSLRTRLGVPACSLAPDPRVDGLFEVSQGRAVLTRSGRMLANEVSARLIVEP